MRAKKKLLMCMLTCIVLLAGCGANTTPEIIMPEQPMVSAVADQPSAGFQSQETLPGGSAEQSTVPTATPTDKYTVYLITMDLTDSYWKSIDDGCLNAVNEIGNITYKWTGPDAHDDALQSACIDAAVADGADAILLAANSKDGVNASLQKVADAGCKIVYVDSSASYDCVTALSTDNTIAGKTAGETMISALQAKGITNGMIGIMGVTADTASCVARENGFRQAFEGTDFTLADTVFMQDDAGNITSAVNEGLSQNYAGFFGTNEGTTVAIGNALKEASTESTIVGFDTSDTVLSLVADGTIYATMQQNPTVMGHDGMIIAIQAIKSEANPFDAEWKEYFEERMTYKMLLSLKGRKSLLYMWNKQERKCPLCGQPITAETQWNVREQKENGQIVRYLVHDKCYKQNR